MLKKLKILHSSLLLFLYRLVTTYAISLYIKSTKICNLLFFIISYSCFHYTIYYTIFAKNDDF